MVVVCALITHSDFRANPVLLSCSVEYSEGVFPHCNVKLGALSVDIVLQCRVQAWHIPKL